VLATPDLAQLRVTASFQTDKVDRWITALTRRFRYRPGARPTGRSAVAPSLRRNGAKISREPTVDRRFSLVSYLKEPRDGATPRVQHKRGQGMTMSVCAHRDPLAWVGLYGGNSRRYLLCCICLERTAGDAGHVSISPASRSVAR